MNTLDAIIDSRIFAILRAVPADRLTGVAQALIRGGVRALEVTFVQNGRLLDTAESICALRDALGSSIMLGAGTVMTVEQLETAKMAGAEFIVAPNTDERLIARAKELSLTAIPGALTPTEVARAYAAGADAVKLFPAGLMGAEYLKAIRGPMPHIPIAAVGNITENNIAAFKNAGACAFGISSGLASAEEINNCRYEDITQNCKRYFGALNA